MKEFLGVCEKKKERREMRKEQGGTNANLKTTVLTHLKNQQIISFLLSLFSSANKQKYHVLLERNSALPEHVQRVVWCQGLNRPVLL